MLLAILITVILIGSLSGTAYSLTFNSRKARVRSAVGFTVATLGAVVSISFTYFMELAMPEVVVTFDDYAISALIIVQTGLVAFLGVYGSLTYGKHITDRAHKAEAEYYRQTVGIADWERKAQEIFG